MSDDYAVICHACKKYRHFGQRMANIQSLGYGSNDVKGQKEVLEFVGKHIWCNPVIGLQLIVSDPFMDSAHHGNYVNDGLEFGQEVVDRAKEKYGKYNRKFGAPATKQEIIETGQLGSLTGEDTILDHKEIK